QLGEALGAWVAHGSGHEAEVAPAFTVGADVEAITAVVDRVLVVLLARREHAPVGRRLLRGEITPLAAREGARGQENEGAAPRALHADAEELVRLLVDQLVPGQSGPMAPAAIWPLRLVLRHGG